MKQTDILIAGAGAAGLMAALTLTRAGRTVTVLEARDRIGGRIHTISEASQQTHLEMGAEFVHGNLPLTLSLLQEAGIKFSKTQFETIRHNNGKFEKEDHAFDGWDELLHRMHSLEYDIPLHDFLQKYFPGDKYSALRTMVEKYAMGYDTADVRTISTFAIRTEWENEEEDAQYRIEGGYGRLISYMADQIRKSGGNIILNKSVSKIEWNQNGVQLYTSDNSSYTASRAIIALPLGILRAPDTVSFYPQIPDYTNAICNIGFGYIVKILMKFRKAFWKDYDVFGSSLSNATKLLLTNEIIPTFWTQSNQFDPLLTGWLGGPPALALENYSPEEMKQAAIESLANIFTISPSVLNDELEQWYIADWNAEPHTRGSYAYDTVNSADARKILREPVANKIYFAGEYLYNGVAMGTVEAALTSGWDIAAKIPGPQNTP